MKKSAMKKNASAFLVIGVLLMAFGAYQALYPVMATATPQQPSMQELATTSFEVVGANPSVSIKVINVQQGTTISDGDSLLEGTAVRVVCTYNFDGYTPRDDVSVYRYGGGLSGCFPTMAETLILVDQLNSPSDSGTLYASHVIDQIDADDCTAQYICGLNGDDWGAWGPTINILNSETPTPGQIDDTTDTLVTDATSYRPGDTVTMIAWGENIGDGTWSGKVTFTVTQPDGTVYVVKESSGVSIEAGLSESFVQTFILPSDAAAGAWSIQSKWIDVDGNVHAMASIDLGTETIWGVDVNILGALILIIGLIMVLTGLRGAGKI